MKHALLLTLLLTACGSPSHDSGPLTCEDRVPPDIIVTELQSGECVFTCRLEDEKALCESLGGECIEPVSKVDNTWCRGIGREQ